jgi:type II secretory ATPase GspE/PulE/Tfp pilus assembly ATPase PilB-like protein
MNNDNSIVMNVNENEDAPHELSPIEFVNSIIQEAYLLGASDIHIEPLKNQARIRLRINGDIVDLKTVPLEQFVPISNSLKVMANLSYQTSSLPEDGHFSSDFRNANNEYEKVDIRLSIFPTINGEAIVLRILNRSEVLLSMKDLGMYDDDLIKLKRLSMKRYGMILINGPVGGGKTTTMYSIIMELSQKDDKKNIITLEDPVEYNFDFIRQSQVRPGIGFTFAEGMKSILRQDPDVILIGEIRDPETAAYAVEAALTGRSVFSTIHANSAVGTISRLVDLDVERGLLCYALNATIAQRLLKKICPACKQSYTPQIDYIQMMGLENESIDYKKGTGCPECNNTGFQGRTGVFEILEFNDEIRSAIIEKYSLDKIISIAKKTGFKTLCENAIQKIKDGEITIEEVVKIVL